MGVLTASTGQRPGTLLNSTQDTEQPPQQGIGSKMSAEPRLGNPALECIAMNRGSKAISSHSGSFKNRVSKRIRQFSSVSERQTVIWEKLFSTYDTMGMIYDLFSMIIVIF